MWHPVLPHYRAGGTIATALGHRRPSAHGDGDLNERMLFGAMIALGALATAFAGAALRPVRDQRPATLSRPNLSDTIRLASPEEPTPAILDTRIP